jgi:PTS system nitrogen regulatory IIA component
MQIADILTPERTHCQIQLTNKEHVFKYFSQLFATESDSLTSHDIFECLLEREQLGSTGLGKGIAIPHARVTQCEVSLAAFLQLNQGIEFDALDNQPVDLLFALVVPEQATQEHLELLAQLAAMFGDAHFREQLRCAQNCSEKFNLLTQWRPLVD